LGGLLPSSEAEDRLMGERRDRLAGRLSSMAGDAYEQAREAAREQAGRAQEHLGEAYDRSRDRVGGQGVSPQQGATALGGVARDLREAVERTAQEAGSAAREAMGKPEKDGGSSENPAASGNPAGSTGSTPITGAPKPDPRNPNSPL
jgi:hypothetical protein